MYRTDLAIQIKSIIDQSSPENWPGGIVLGTESPAVGDPNHVPVEVALDPFNDVATYKPGIYIIPGYKQFGDNSNRRRNTGVPDTIFITVALSVRLTGQVEDNEQFDLVPKAEWEKWLKLKDDLDDFLYRFDYSPFKIRINEPPDIEPPDEISLDSRYYLETTVFGYVTC